MDRPFTFPILFSLTVPLLGVAVAVAAPPSKGDPARGQALAEQHGCGGCHGADGNSPASAFPNLAAQQAVYLQRELLDYKSGARANPIMQPVAAALSEGDIADLSAYYASRRPVPLPPGDPALLAAGKRLYLNGNSATGIPSCDGCHEENGEGAGKFPRVAGQHADYALEQLRLYKEGQRANGARVMVTVAQRLTPEEARAVAEYMASMK